MLRNVYQHVHCVNPHTYEIFSASCHNLRDGQRRGGQGPDILVPGQQPPSKRQQNKKELIVNYRKRGPDLDSHQHQHKDRETTALLPLQAAEAQHGLQDTLQLLQVHHRKHPDWLRTCMHTLPTCSGSHQAHTFTTLLHNPSTSTCPVHSFYHLCTLVYLSIIFHIIFYFILLYIYIYHILTFALCMSLC